MEKERYEYIPRTIDNDEFIYDDDDEFANLYELKECCDLLNAQDKKIKELKSQLAEKDKEIEGLQRKYRIEYRNSKGWYHETMKLEQQLKELKGE